MLISANNSYKGLTMDRVLALRAGDKPARDPLDELFDILIEQNGSVSTVYAHHTDKDMTLALAQPWCSVGSDGSALAIDGPLRRGNPQLVDRGLLRPGMFADVTVFDPEMVIDRATYTEPFAYCEGIEYVVVNGELVLDRGERTAARPGRALRRMPAEMPEGRK
jgi:N-acyl-D-aspartate/D-glutamate deacylase